MTKLHRVDVEEENSLIFNEMSAPVCQDTWIFQAPVLAELVKKTDFPFGIPGCDNHIAWLFREHLYHLGNPCLKIITRHLHSSEKRNNKPGEKVKGEYAPLPPSGDI